MNKNMGSSDKTIRITLAALFGILYFTGIVTGTLGAILLVLGVLFLLTSIAGFCPIYVPLKINTITKKKD